MVTLKIRPWEPIDGITHTKTSWRVTSDVTGDTVLEAITDSTIWLTIWYATLTVPPSTVYYASAQRTLSDGTVLPWTDPVAIRNDNINTAILLHQEVLIETPTITIDDTDTDNILITTSKGRFIGDGHFSTHWILENSRGEIIYSKLYDETNLTTLTIAKTDIGYINLNKLIIKVIHCTATCIESDVGIKVLNKTKFNFTVDIDLININPYEDLTIPFKKIDLNNIIGVKTITLKHRYSGNIIYTKTFSIEIDGIVIPKEVLLPDTEYVLLLNVVDYSVNDTMDLYITTNSYTTRSLYNNVNITYDNTFTAAGDDNNVLLPDYFSYYETFDYNILMPNSNDDTDIYAYKYNRDSNSLSNTYNRIPGANVNTNGVGSYIRVLEGNKLIVDSLDSTGSIFYVYDYNPAEKTAVLLRSLSRATESTPIGKTNALVQQDIDTFYYLPVDNATTLMKYDVNTNILTATAPHPTDPRTDSVIVDIGDNKILMIGNGDTVTYVYNTTTDDWSVGIAIPLAFRNMPLKVVKLLNGDSIIYRTTKDGTYNDDDILLYKHIDMVFEIIPSNTNNTNAYTSAIVLNNGHVLLCNQDTNGGLTKTLFK